MKTRTMMALRLRVTGILVASCVHLISVVTVAAAVAAAGGDGSTSGAVRSEPYCSSTFHVWQPGQDAQQMLREVYTKMDNLTYYTKSELMEMKARMSDELARVHNWTYSVDRRVFQIQVDRMDEELIQMKFSASSAKVKMQLDLVNRRVDDLEQSLYNVRNKLRSAAGPSSNIRPSHEELPQHQGISRDMGQELKNSVADLKAEWILLKRDVESLKKETGRIRAEQAELANDTMTLKLSLDVTKSATERVDNRIFVLMERQEKLSNKFEDLTSDSTQTTRLLEQHRQDVAHNGAKILALQAKARILETELKSLQRLMTKSGVERSPTQTLGVHLQGGTGPVATGGHNIMITEKQEHPVFDSTGDANGERFPRDCHEVYHSGNHVSSVYQIRVEGARFIMPVYCEMINKTGYTVIQRRVDGTISFNRGWSEYKQGFGNPYGDMWLGNELIHLLTVQRKYILRIDFWDWNGNQYFAEYARFYVDDEEEQYRLRVGSFTGTAGDSLSYHDKMAFSTPDVDNDLHARHCAAENKGGWWYNSCFYSQLNGLYHTAWYSQTNYSDGTVWFTLKDSELYSLKKVEMKLKPQSL